MAHGWKRRVCIVLVLAVLVALALFGRETAAWWARQAAIGKLSVGAIGGAETWLAWAARLDPDDYRTHLLRAACFRHLGQRDKWDSAIAAAKQSGAPGKRLRLEIKLGDFHWGKLDQISPNDVDALQVAGAAPREAATAVVHGLLVKKELTKARQVIDTWAQDAADEAQALYLRGLCFWTDGQREAAQTEFQIALDKQAGHEMARASLARSLEQQELLAEALKHYAYLAAAVPHREAAHVDLARVLRKLGRREDAQSVLPPRPAPDDASVTVAIEIAEREYDAGNYKESRRWFDRADLDEPHIADTLRTAASAVALSGDRAYAEKLFARVDEAQSISRFVGELRRRLDIDPSDKVAAAELQHLLQRPTATSPQFGVHGSTPEKVDPLYLQRCAACHGVDGNGKGRAARFLNPRPRNLRTDKYRLVSSLNGIPAPQDIQRVIQRGIPGTAMPPFPDATEYQLQQLAKQVQQFQQEGIRRQLIAELQRDDERAEHDELARMVALLTTPSQVASIPSINPGTAQTINRGREMYLALGCRHCHGSDGSGASGIPLFDDQGQPVTPRDLTRDPMKGGPEAESLFLRIRLGMPGTPHPAACGLENEELTALVHFCLSLSVKPTRVLTNHERALRAATIRHRLDGDQ